MSNQLMKIGGIGSIIILVGFILTLILGFMMAGDIINAGASVAAMLAVIQNWYMFLLVASIILAAGLVMTGVGMFGVNKKYAYPLAMVAGIITIIGAIISFIPVVSLVSGPIIGVGILLMGIPFIALKDKMGLGTLGMATGVLCIITGALVASVLGGFFGWIVGIPTCILLAVSFFKAK